MGCPVGWPEGCLKAGLWAHPRAAKWALQWVDQWVDQWADVKAVLREHQKAASMADEQVESLVARKAVRWVG